MINSYIDMLPTHCLKNFLYGPLNTLLNIDFVLPNTVSAKVHIKVHFYASHRSSAVLSFVIDL